MKNLKRFVLGVAVGIALFGLAESLFGLVGLALIAFGLIYWKVEINQKKVG